MDVFGDERELSLSLMGVTAALRAMDAHLSPPEYVREPLTYAPSARLYRHR